MRAAAASTRAADDLKAQIIRGAGRKHGLDLAPDQAKALEATMRATEGQGMAAPHEQELAGTRWSLVYHGAADISAGKLGPFVGKCETVFHTRASDERVPGRFCNVISLGPLRIEGDGEYWIGDEPLVGVRFTNLKFLLAGLKARTAFWPHRPHACAACYWKREASVTVSHCSAAVSRPKARACTARCARLDLLGMFHTGTRPCAGQGAGVREAAQGTLAHAVRRRLVPGVRDASRKHGSHAEHGGGEPGLV